MSYKAYLFEAKSIQAYLLNTSRLKEIVGGSEMVEALTGNLLDDALKVINSNIDFSRRGGGAFYAFSENEKAIDQLASMWPLLVIQYAPDLPYVQGHGKGCTALDAFNEAHTSLLIDRNRMYVRLPQASPFAERNRRTGEPATIKAMKEPVDAATARKLKYSKGELLVRRFAPEAISNAWPLNLSPSESVAGERDFPFDKDDRNIALVHADGNGLGQLLKDLTGSAEGNPVQYVEIFRAFSEAVSGATRAAAESATQTVLEPAQKNGIYPARPIVLGGDDLTIIVRADLALSFTSAFLVAFASESALRLAELKTKFDLPALPNRLTACAGIAYAKANQPFYILHNLAEGLCKHAKMWAKKENPAEVASSLSFHRVTTALVDDFGTILERELTTGSFRHTLECYAIETGKGLPELDKLLKLQALLANPNLSRGSMRELLGLIGRDAQDQRHYARWREVMRERHTSELNEFDSLLNALASIEKTDDLPYHRMGADKLQRSPLGDVITLMSVDNLPEPIEGVNPQEVAI